MARLHDDAAEMDPLWDASDDDVRPQHGGGSSDGGEYTSIPYDGPAEDPRYDDLDDDADDRPQHGGGSSDGGDYSSIPYDHAEHLRYDDDDDDEGCPAEQ